jgi:hypothetical protein
LISVVAGILPAVEPGILPGGKTARRKTKFPSHVLSGSLKVSRFLPDLLTAHEPD